ncbi:long-chain-fatty-acid--CoA ligase [Psychrobacter sp. Sarcosine-3u-12]|uniref:long-chain-fatty-acid--CoA ligase n=1 Tax=Psychrobacter sp. Sarcosine-3u-12 TaxID=2058325 RepID=UPI000C332573|nr:long-chain-fatty-acid--CoA ligase [Psychrobacter sp. Sarcosine-3u-12]PKG36549.1 long-chain fatty acid--CoA ligase [Psychrobacter sp. Sarcosine-3u-12]
MLGKMMYQPLLISSLIEHAAQYHGDTAILSKEVNGEMTKSDWLTVSNNSKRLANALQALGLKLSERIATLAWNNRRHLEAWYAISGSGMICHTINPRLFPEQLAYIINDADDQALFFDITFLPLISAIKEHIKGIKHFIYLGDRDEKVLEKLPNALFFDELLADNSPDFDWPQFDEKLASSLCYTSGTTGNPKGILYSHRSSVLHAMALCMPDVSSLSAQDVLLPVVPMFHVNAWGTPYAAALTGCSLILPGPNLDGDSLVSVIDDYKVTVALGVPTIWQSLLTAAKNRGSKLDSMTRTIVGGAACPPSVIKTFREDFNCDAIHGWGMTETSPLGTMNQIKAKHKSLSKEEINELRKSQGRPPYGVKIRLMDTEQKDQPVAEDGESQGRLQIRGHWVIDDYFTENKDAITADGWFDTGDIATIDGDGYMNIRDRSKDLIKSGGEWISSVELENIAVEHPEVKMAAAIAATHKQWGERPVLIVVKEAGSAVDEAQILEFYQGKVASWQIPDKVVFVDNIVLNGAGKMMKNNLRDEHGDVLLA